MIYLDVRKIYDPSFVFHSITSCVAHLYCYTWIGNRESSIYISIIHDSRFKI